jgi:hypothetical protein
MTPVGGYQFVIGHPTILPESTTGRTIPNRCWVEGTALERVRSAARRPQVLPRSLNPLRWQARVARSCGRARGRRVSGKTPAQVVPHAFPDCKEWGYGDGTCSATSESLQING